MTNKNKNKFLNFKQGSITVYILMIASISVTLLTSLAIFVANSQKNSSNEVSRQKALQFAEEGVYYYRWYLAHSLDGKNKQQIQEFWENGSPIGTVDPYGKAVVNFDGESVGEFEITVTPPSSNSTIILVESVGWTYRHPNIKKRIKVRFRKPSWSEYSVLANDVMRFGEGTNVFGPIHSNNGIRFDGVANNVVTSSVAEYSDPDTGLVKPGVWTSQSDESSVFLAGNEFPVPSIDFNSVTSDLSLIRTDSQINGLYFDDDTYEAESCDYVWSGWPPPWWDWVCAAADRTVFGYHFTLRVDDKVEVRRVLNYEGDQVDETATYLIIEETDAEIFSLPANGLIFADKNIWVDGQINSAQLTIASADLDGSTDSNIYINNDILYTNYNGDDIIGLIAENNILVGLYSEDNLEIDAALLAQKGRVGREYYYWNWSWSDWLYRDEITVRGSIATNKRYGFAYTDGTGYDVRNLYFDNNLIYYPPPYFPTGTVYELDLWEDVR